MTPIKVWAVLRDGKYVQAEFDEASAREFISTEKHFWPPFHTWTTQPGTFTPDKEK